MIREEPLGHDSPPRLAEGFCFGKQANRVINPLETDGRETPTGHPAGPTPA